ncbi:MAG: carbohydrate kinase family protein [Actinobacteria bacterium]|nr:carbohydrate kinase family protein [Actinomycetota bacterium]
MEIACFGGAHIDTKAHLLEGARLGTSNPAHVMRAPGGVACNVARSLARLGAQAAVCSLTGDDPAADALHATLQAEGIDVTGLAAAPGRATASYLAVLDPDGALVLGVADMQIYDEAGREWAEQAAAHAAGAAVWMVDANLPAATLEVLVALARVPVVADPVSVPKASRLLPVLAHLEAVFPDRAEAGVLARLDGAVPAEAAAAIHAIGSRRVVVSLGPDGAHEHTADGAGTRPALAPRRVVDVTGAGDALAAGYTYALAAGEEDPLGWGLAAASMALETDASIPEGLSAQAVRDRIGA